MFVIEYRTESNSWEFEAPIDRRRCKVEPKSGLIIADCQARASRQLVFTRDRRVNERSNNRVCDLFGFDVICNDDFLFFYFFPFSLLSSFFIHSETKENCKQHLNCKQIVSVFLFTLFFLYQINHLANSILSREEFLFFFLPYFLCYLHRMNTTMYFKILMV